jgi:hypothetical protein
MNAMSETNQGLIIALSADTKLVRPSLVYGKTRFDKTMHIHNPIWPFACCFF